MSRTKPLALADVVSSSQILEMFAAAGRPIKLRTWASYVARQQAPQPVSHLGRMPVWHRREVEAFIATRRVRNGVVDDLRNAVEAGLSVTAEGGPGWDELVRAREELTVSGRRPSDKRIDRAAVLLLEAARVVRGRMGSKREWEWDQGLYVAHLRTED